MRVSNDEARSCRRGHDLLFEPEVFHERKHVPAADSEGLRPRVRLDSLERVRPHGSTNVVAGLEKNNSVAVHRAFARVDKPRNSTTDDNGVKRAHCRYSYCSWMKATRSVRTCGSV